MDNPQLVDASYPVFQMVACRIAVSDCQMVKMVCVVYICLYIYIHHCILYISIYNFNAVNILQYIIYIMQLYVFIIYSTYSLHC